MGGGLVKYARVVRRLLLAAAAACLAPAGPGAVAPASAQPPSLAPYLARGFLGRPSLETGPVEFRHGGVRLRIPRNHVTGLVGPRGPGDEPTLIAVASFPDFAGARRDTLPCFASARVADCDVVLFAFGHALGGGPGERPWYERERVTPAPHGGLVESTVLRGMYAFPAADPREAVTMVCGDLTARCNMTLAAGGASWSVLFRVGLLPRWREVADGTRALIERFAADALNHESNPSR